MGTKWIHEKMESQELETMGRENLVEEFYYISRAEKRDGDNHLTEKSEHLFFFFFFFLRIGIFFGHTCGSRSSQARDQIHTIAMI